MYKNRKPIIIGILCVLVVVMAIGFALLRENLTITGSSHVDSNWNIRITSITANATGSAEDKEASGECTTRTSGSCNSTSATFNAGLNTPGDTVTYTVTVTNSGSLDGVVSGITLTPETGSSDPILVTKSGLGQGDKITANGGTNTIQVIVTYNPATESQPSNLNSEITLTINYQQDLGQVSPPAPTYTAYSIGDVVEYKGSNWRVIKNSTTSEDYVTLIKETVLTSNELGNYVYEYSCTSTDVYYNSRGCTTEGQKIKQDTAVFANNNSTDYATSNVKAAVEAYATREGMMNDLVEVDNYKIRLITLNELTNNLGAESIEMTGRLYYQKTENTPTWVYSGYVENQDNVSGYWTMTPDANNASSVWSVSLDGKLDSSSVDYNRIGVRPVINLLKSNIPSQQ